MSGGGGWGVGVGGGLGVCWGGDLPILHYAQTNAHGGRYNVT